MEKKLFFAVTLILIYISFELLSLLGLVFLKKVRHVEYHPVLASSLCPVDQKALEDLVSGKTTYLLHSRTLGWTIKPRGYWDNLYKANAQGIRADREYQPFPASDVLRIATFGDSFTHGEEVADKETWQEQLDRLNPAIESINFGVGGYGLDQSFLRYTQEGTRYHPQIVLIGFMEENINRLVNVFRPFYMPGIPLTKPRFIIQHDSLVLLPNPLPDSAASKELLHNPRQLLAQFGKYDYHYITGIKTGMLDFSPSVRLMKLLYQSLETRYREYTDSAIYKNGCFNPRSEAFRICTRLLDAFCLEVQKNKSLPIILLFPNRTDIERYRQNRTRIYDPLIAYIRSKGYRFIDLLDAFEKYAGTSRMDKLFLDYHYSPLGNAIVAQFLNDYLSDNQLVAAPVLKRGSSAGPGTLQRAGLKKP